jgi:hypothetical protein
MTVARPLTLLRDSTDVAATDDAGSEPTTPDASSPRTATATSGQDSAPGAAATTAPSGGPATTIAERDLDEMVRRLYPRLRRSLSSELLVARERAGTLADLR